MIHFLFFITLFLGVFGVNQAWALPDTATSTSTYTSTSTNTATVTQTSTDTPLPTDTSTVTASETSTATATQTFTSTATSSSTNTASATVSPTNTIATTATSTSTLTETSTATVSATFTISSTPTFTPTVTPTPTPVPGGCIGIPIAGYSYPNPASGANMTVLCDLCEPSSVVVSVYNTSATRVAVYDEQGSAGSNLYSVDISSFAHGVYFLEMVSMGPSGTRKSEIKKFAVVR